MVSILDMNATRPVPDDLARRIFPEVVVRSPWDICCHGVHDDGSCWWHSLAIALNFDGAFTRPPHEQIACGHRLRALVRATITDEATWRRFWERLGVAAGVPPTAASVRAKLSDNSVWSDFFICVYSFSLLGANAIFVDMETGEPYCGVTHDVRIPREVAAVCGHDATCANALARLPNARGALVVIAWKQYAHFEPIVLRRAHADVLREDERTRGDVYERAPSAYVAMYSGRIAHSLLQTYRSARYCANVTLAATAARQRASVRGGSTDAFIATHGRLTRALEMTYSHALGAGVRVARSEKKSACPAETLQYDADDPTERDHAVARRSRASRARSVPRGEATALRRDQERKRDGPARA